MLLILFWIIGRRIQILIMNIVIRAVICTLIKVVRFLKYRVSCRSFILEKLLTMFAVIIIVIRRIWARIRNIRYSILCRVRLLVISPQRIVRIQIRILLLMILTFRNRNNVFMYRVRKLLRRAKVAVVGNGLLVFLVLINGRTWKSLLSLGKLERGRRTRRRVALLYCKHKQRRDYLRARTLRFYRVLVVGLRLLGVALISCRRTGYLPTNLFLETHLGRKERCLSLGHVRTTSARRRTIILVLVRIIRRVLREKRSGVMLLLVKQRRRWRWCRLQSCVIKEIPTRTTPSRRLSPSRSTIPCEIEETRT